MSKTNDQVFVLWGKEFDEMAATIFITQLRRAGLRVQVVGLTQRRSSGAWGVALAPDITLETAFPLVSRIICLVIPCTPAAGKWLRNDPRLSDFFQQAHANAVKFVVGPLDKAALDLFPAAMDQAIVYPDYQALFEQAQEIAQSLTRVI